MTNELKQEAREAWTLHARTNKIRYPKTCTACGKEGKTQAHHDDYKYPLEVMFVCKKCHTEIHKKLGMYCGAPKHYNFAAIGVMQFVTLKGLKMSNISGIIHYCKISTGMNFKCFSAGDSVVVFRIS